MTQPIDITEAAALAMYGRGYGRLTDDEASRAARTANAVVAALDTICNGLSTMVESHRRKHADTITREG